MLGFKPKRTNLHEKYDYPTLGAGPDAPRLALASADTACAPGYLPLTLANTSAAAPAFMFVADESPLHQKLGLYETR